MTKVKEKTIEEVRDEFVNHLIALIDIWDSYKNKTSKEKLEGLTHSILVALDGQTFVLPAFIVAPHPHETDKKYRIDNNEDYYPENHKIENKIKCNIAGELHHIFNQKK